MNVVSFIFARGGSKGLPGKNIRNLGGRPLIAWAIENARAVRLIRRVIVSTDSEEIADVARRHGAEVPFMRPAHLSEDGSPEWLAWRHALEFIREEEGALPEAMVSLPATAPLRLPADVEKCIDRFSIGDSDVVITVSEAQRNPYFNMVKSNPEGFVELVIPPGGDVSCRQDAPLVYDMATVAYVADPEFVLNRSGIFEGRVSAVKVPVERSIDIDSLLDFKLSEYLFSELKIADSISKK